MRYPFPAFPDEAWFCQLVLTAFFTICYKHFSQTGIVLFFGFIFKHNRTIHIGKDFRKIAKCRFVEKLIIRYDRGGRVSAMPDQSP